MAILGVGREGRQLARRLRSTPCGLPFELVGLFDGQPNRDGGAAPDGTARGSVSDLVQLCRAGAVDQIFLAVPWGGVPEVDTWLAQLRELPVEVCLYPGAPAVALRTTGVSFVGTEPVFTVIKAPIAGRSYLFKELQDRALALVAIVAFMPVMLAIVLCIRLDSPGSILFRQKRYGLNNDTIEVLKFRTMHVGSLEPAAGRTAQACRHDPRVTRVGRVLRRYSLDELPQLFNVLHGEMSIVGPRPHAVAHNEHYAALIEAYASRHRVKPGMTGWAQVNGLRGETSTLDLMEQRVRHDLYYIEHWSPVLDVKIILRTVFQGFAAKNAY